MSWMRTGAMGGMFCAALAVVGGCLPEGLIDADGDGFAGDDVEAALLDCDDSNAAISPDATERCGDGIDEDCDGEADEGFDADGDGFLTCQVAGQQVDCDDTNSEVRPGAEEICGDDLDNDCDGLADVLVDAWEPNNTQPTATYLGLVDNGVLTVNPTVYIAEGPDLRDYFRIDTEEDDPSNTEAFKLTVQLTGIPEGIDLDLVLQPGGSAQGISNPRSGNTAEEVIYTGTRNDDSGEYVIQIKLMSKTNGSGVNCLPYTMTILQQG